MRDELPFLRVSEETLVEDLAAILERRREWPQIGARSRRYVERWHDPKRISHALLNVYRDADVPFTLDEV
jgi:hypothetical protein